MRRLIVSTSAVAVLLLGLSARGVSENAPKVLVPQQAAPVAGRFQMTAVAGQIFLLDTSTGQVWKHEPGKTDEHFFESKVKTDADWSTGPTYRSKPLNFWVALLRDKDSEYQEQGMEAISHFGEQAKAALPDLLRILIRNLPTQFDAKEGIPWCIARIDPRHDELHALLGHKDSAIRRSAAIAMALLGDVDPNRRPGQSVVRTEAESEPQSKWRLPKDKDAIPILIETLNDRELVQGDFSFAAVSLECLALFKTDAAVAVPGVTTLLADKNPTHRQLAVEVLGVIAPNAKETLTATRAALKDADAQVRAMAAQMIGQLGDRESVPALKALMKDADPLVRQGVVQAFGYFKGDAETLVPILVEVLQTPDSKLRMPVFNPDGKQHEESNQREVNVVEQAFTSLAKFGPAAKAAVPELVKQASKLQGMMFTQSALIAIKKIAPDEWEKLRPPTPGVLGQTPAGLFPLPSLPPNDPPRPARPQSPVELRCVDSDASCDPDSRYSLATTFYMIRLDDSEFPRLLLLGRRLNREVDEPVISLTPLTAKR